MCGIAEFSGELDQALLELWCRMFVDQPTPSPA
jgi:hypothetical protein